MTVTLFSRIAIGYLVIFILVLAASLCAMGQLYRPFPREESQKALREAMDLFSKLMQDNPETPLAERAKIWLGVLQVRYAEPDA